MAIVQTEIHDLVCAECGGRDGITAVVQFTTHGGRIDGRLQVVATTSTYFCKWHLPEKDTAHKPEEAT